MKLQSEILAGRPDAPRLGGARGPIGPDAARHGWGAASRCLAVLARVNVLGVLPTTLFLFGVSGERTWVRFLNLAAIVFVIANLNFVLLDRFYCYFWAPLAGHRRRPAIALLAIPMQAVLGLLAAILGLLLLSAVGGPLPSRTGPIVAMSVGLSVAYSIAIFRLEDARKSRHQTQMRLEEAETKQHELEEQRTSAEIRALQALVQPHFVFNTLNSIAALIHDQPDRAEATTLGLARLMRHILEIRGGTMATLESELGFVRAYLDIAQIRMGDRFRYEIAVPDGLLSRTIPALLLQPLVENAVKHGAYQRLEGGCVSVVARELDDEGWEVQVIDNGPGFSTATGTGSGMGLVRDRLARIYGRAAQVRLERDDAASQSVATIEFPGHPRVEGAPPERLPSQRHAVIPPGVAPAPRH